jgi:hypothetical protein
MRREIHDLVESVRALGVRLTGQPAPKCIRLVGDPTDFAERLAAVQESLEAADASGALADDGGPEAPKADDEAVRLRKALDGVLRYIQVRGVDMEEAVEIVADALGVEGGKKASSAFVTLPKFAPKGWKKKRSFKPRLKLLPDSPGDASINGLRKMAFEAEMTTTLLGSTVRDSQVAYDAEREQNGPLRR